MRIIAFAGKKNVGKSTLCDSVRFASNSTGMYMARLAFATPLKEICSILFPCDNPDVYYGSDEVKSSFAPKYMDLYGDKYSSYRRILQTVGTDLFRKHVHEDFWLHRMQHSIDCHTNVCNTVVIDDCRFENEAAFVRERGGLVIHIISGGAISSDMHASEVELTYNSNDMLIINNKTKEDLEYNTKLVLSKLADV